MAAIAALLAVCTACRAGGTGASTGSTSTRSAPVSAAGIRPSGAPGSLGPVSRPAGSKPALATLPSRIVSTETTAVDSDVSTTGSVTVSTKPDPAPTQVVVRTTVTESADARTVSIAPPASTQEPTPAEGDCPYLSTARVKIITGQRQGATQIIATSPYPVCVFYRSDGGEAGRIRIVVAANDAEATAAVDAHVPVAGSLPASYPIGWSGGSISKGEQVADARADSIYAVAKGKIAIIAEEDESPSIKARTMAACALLNLEMIDTGPSICTSSADDQ